MIDFACTNTWSNIKDKVFPALDEVIRQELRVIVYHGIDVDDEERAEAAHSCNLMQSVICSYIKHLTDAHVKTAEDCEQLLAYESSSDLYDLGNRESCD